MSLSWEESLEETISSFFEQYDVDPNEGWRIVRDMAEANMVLDDGEHPNVRMGRDVMENLVRFFDEPDVEAPTDNPMRDLEEFGCYLANRFQQEPLS